MSDNTTAELKDIAEQAAAKAVAQTLVTLGIDVSDPIKAQRDFAVLRDLRKLVDDEEFQADLSHLRKWRKAVEGVQTKGLLTVIGILVTGTLGMIGLGIKGWLGGGH